MRTGCVIKEIDHMKPLFLLALSTLPFHLSHAAQPPLELTIQKKFSSIGAFDHAYSMGRFSQTPI